MLKLIEALVIFLGGHLLTNAQAELPNGSNPMDLLISKSRVIAIFMVGAITIPLLWVSGLMMTIIAISHLAGDTNPDLAYRYYLYFGIALTVLSASFGMFGLSKKRFEVKPEKHAEPLAPIHATHQVEQIVVNVIKEFLKPIPPQTSNPAAATQPPNVISNA